MDTVFVKNLRLSAIIGCLPWERKIKQTLLLSFELKASHEYTSQTDSIDRALDYSKISERLIEYVEQSQFQLIETLAEKIAQLLQEEFAVPALRLTLEKPGALAQAESVGVRLERGFS